MISEEHFVSGSQDGYVTNSMLSSLSRCFFLLHTHTHSLSFSLILFHVPFNLHCSCIFFLHLSSIALWSITKKKPLVVKPHHAPSMTSSVPEEHWVTAVAAYPNTDLVASGTYIVHYSIVLLILQLYPPSNFVLI